MGKKKGGAPPAPPKPEPPAFLLDLDTVYVRTSNTQLKVQPKAEYINEPPSMNMAMGLDALTGKQLFTIHYKKPPPANGRHVAMQTERPKFVRILPARIMARYSCLTDEVSQLPDNHVPQEGKYILDNEPQVFKYNLQYLDLDGSPDAIQLGEAEKEED